MWQKSTPQLTMEQKRNLKSKFNEMDKDHSGSVSLLEMGRFFDSKGVNVSEAALKMAFKEASTGTTPAGEYRAFRIVGKTYM